MSMAQARRISAMVTTKQIPSETTESLKGISQQSYKTTIAATLMAMKPTRPPLHRLNEMVIQNSEAQFTTPEPQRKPSEADNSDKAAIVLSSKEFVKTPVRKSVRYVIFKNSRRIEFITIIISLPTELVRISGMDLTSITSSDSVDDLESMSKIDLQYIDGSFLQIMCSC